MDSAARQADPAERPLVRRAKAGDYNAFEQLVARYERPIYALARRILLHDHDAEEAVQETFLSVVEHLGQFAEESSFHTWLVRIATNEALQLLRKRRGRLAQATGPIDDEHEALPHPDYIAPWRNDPAEIAQQLETRRLLDEALAGLDEKYRLVFVLRDVQELSTQETAEALEISPANVKVRLMRARLMLRERLTQEFGDPAARVAPHRHD